MCETLKAYDVCVCDLQLCFFHFSIFPLLLQNTGVMQTSTKEKRKTTLSRNHVTLPSGHSLSNAF